MSRTLLEACPFGGLNAAVSSDVDLLPYQFEPALAMLQDGSMRVMIADAVGLGKTIQAGLIVRQLAAQSEFFRALVVVPAGLRDQWATELRQRFDIDAAIVTSAWLARTARELPRDIGPWHLPGVYISSFELIRRPEVLRPLEDTQWDLLVVDEAHVATLGSARRAAVDAIALRARRIVLLTATPHGGDDEEFRALCRIGTSDRRSEPITFFRRTRRDAGLPDRRRTKLLSVRQSGTETRAHRLLEDYTSQVWREAALRGDHSARLAATVLRKRALSSMASLAVSCRRRVALLAAGRPGTKDEQLFLPLDEEDGLSEDAEPESILAAPGLADGGRERRWLEAIIQAADDAARQESKVSRLVRLLTHIREPVLVFTEYRDTLTRLLKVLHDLRSDISILHGGMTPGERSATQQHFNESGSLLLATDAAAEGLNLHRRCRTVVHFELPWSPARLEQRTGRVDRLGQRRTVHEILLVAADTAERLVLAPLLRRAARTASFGSAAHVFTALSESRIAAAIIERTPLESAPVTFDDDMIETSSAARTAAHLEVERLSHLRRWKCSAMVRTPPSGLPATVLRTPAKDLPAGCLYVCTLKLTGANGEPVHSEVVGLHERCVVPRLSTANDVRAFAAECRRQFEAAQDSRVRLFRDRIGHVSRLCLRTSEALLAREQLIAEPATSTARQLVQAGLFDRRAVRTQDRQRGREAALLEELRQRAQVIEAHKHLTPSLQLHAVLLVRSCQGT